MAFLNGYYDLCVPYTTKHNELINIIKQLIRFGYQTVAIEQVFDTTDEKGIPKSREVFPEPVKLDFLSEYRKNINILQRITIIYNNNAISHYMTNSTNLKKFDLIAGLPTTEQSLQHCSQTFNGDIISFTLDKPQVNFSRKYYKLAVQRKMFFEIKYGPSLLDSVSRKALIRKCHTYHSYGKSENIFLSSGASQFIDLRSPTDLGNLGLIFGLSEEQSRGAVSSICKKVVLRAQARRMGKAIISVSVTEEANENSPESEDEEMDVEMADNPYEGPPKKKRLQ